MKQHREVHLIPFLMVAVVILVFFCLKVVHAQSQTTAIVPDNADLELLFDGGFFLEGPAAGPDGCIYFSDITNTANSNMQAGHIWKYDPSTGSTAIFRSPSGMANGIIFDLEGRMLVAEGADFGGRRVTRTDMNTGRSEIVAGLYNGKPFNAPNDLAIDEAGRIYFTDPRYFGHEAVEQPVKGVYRVDPDGSVSLITGDAGMPNGIVISPDQKTLYVASVHYPQDALHALLAFDLDYNGNTVSRRIVIDFAPDIGPDGMAIDVEGNLYLARPSQDPGIYVYSPEGQELAYIPIPEPPSNATFGRGKNSNTLYITASTNLYKIELTTSGYHPVSMSPDAAAIKELSDRYGQAVTDADTDAYMSLLTDDAILMPPGMDMLIGKEAILPLVEATMNRDENTILKEITTPNEIHIAGDWAFDRGITTIRRGLKGEDLSVSYNKYLRIWQKQADGSWKLARVIWNPNPITLAED